MDRRIKGLYVILDRRTLGGRSVLSAAREAVAGGAAVLQFRDKTSSWSKLLRDARAVLRVTRCSRRILIINDRVDLARITGADGVHLGRGDMPIRLARSLLGPRALIGATAHSLSEAVRAVREGADHVAVGCIFRSPTKRGLQPGGLALLQRVRRKVRQPIVAIGGIQADNIASVRTAGADAAAVISAALSQGPIRASCGLLAKLFRSGRRIRG